ncbi:MAG: hypothetical protein ACOYB8_09305 [Eubacteriaceae bacterium]|jgi:hypothetical protein
MKNYFMEDVKCGVTEDKMSPCGPVSGLVAATVKVKDGDKEYWVTNVEVMGIPNFYVSDKDIFQDTLEENYDDQEFSDYLHSCEISSFNNLEISGDYDTLLEAIFNDTENPAVPLLKYLLALTRCEMDQTDELINRGKGHYADEIEIPVSDVEEDYIYEKEQE